MLISDKTVAQLLVECLENEGVEYVFGLPGEENIRIVDAVSGSSIRFILVRSKQGAAFMAEVYGRLTGKGGFALPRSARELSTFCSGWPMDI